MSTNFFVGWAKTKRCPVLRVILYRKKHHLSFRTNVRNLSRISHCTRNDIRGAQTAECGMTGSGGQCFVFVHPTRLVVAQLYF